MNEKAAKLSRFIEFFKSVPEEKFGLEQWKKGEGELSITGPACGTTGCIGGWLTVWSEFIEDGGFNDGGCPLFGGESGECAFSEYFGINDQLGDDITSNPDFYGRLDLEDVTKDQAVAALEYALLTLNEDTDLMKRIRGEN